MISQLIGKKPWFRLSKDVEYSTDFKFFCENQIVVFRHGTVQRFCSQIEAKTFRTNTFRTKIAINKGVINDHDIACIYKKIHKEILAGKHGEGEFVD